MRRSGLGMILIMCALRPACAQAADARVEFEVASVKPAEPLDQRQMMMRANPMMAERIGFSGGPGTRDPGQIKYSAVSLKMLLARAYGLRPGQVLGPSWLDAEYYDIVAKVPPGTTTEQLKLMLQSLLAERFRILAHRESRPARVYTLTVAKGGPKLKPANPEPAPVAVDQDAAAKRPPGMESALKAARAQAQANGPGGHGVGVSFWSTTLADFAQSLSRMLDAPVIDQTGIEGKYDIALGWSSDDPEPIMPGAGPVYASSGPAIASAVQDLGLKLESGKGTVEVLVVDKAEKTPTEN